MQVGNRAALTAFLTQHPDGFYSSLAKLQLDKIVADEVHAAAVEKAKQTEQERVRLAASGAQKDAQARADADARAAEQARLDAEKAQQAAQQQAADAERNRVAAVSNAPAPPPVAPAPDKNINVASLNPAPSQTEITKSVQSELRRVGCYSGSADGDWGESSQRSLSQFNRSAGMKLDVKTANADTLDAIKQKPSRVCPLVCEHGFKADGDRCTKITCAEGSFLNDDNECEKRRASKNKPMAKRDTDDRRERPARERTPALPDVGMAKPRVSAGAGGSGQIVCDVSGCRPVRRGCRVDYQGGSPRNGSGGNVEVCN